MVDEGVALTSIHVLKVGMSMQCGDRLWQLRPGLALTHTLISRDRYDILSLFLQSLG